MSRDGVPQGAHTGMDASHQVSSSAGGRGAERGEVVGGMALSMNGRTEGREEALTSSLSAFRMSSRASAEPVKRAQHRLASTIQHATSTDAKTSTTCDERAMEPNMGGEFEGVWGLYFIPERRLSEVWASSYQGGQAGAAKLEIEYTMSSSSAPRSAQSAAADGGSAEGGSSDMRDGDKCSCS